MLLRNNDTIFRVLKNHDDKSLVIDCIKRTMPKWILTASLSDFEECTELSMYAETKYSYARQLSSQDLRIARDRFTMIAGILPFIGDEQKRSQMISFLADQCSKQTLRRYICLYLVYQDINCLAPLPRYEKQLTPDEQNMRWGLNKFYYTQQKQTLTAAYTMTLKAKYTDKEGKLLPEYPSFTQFRYYFRKTRDKKKEYISRNGLKNYQIATLTAYLSSTYLILTVFLWGFFCLLHYKQGANTLASFAKWRPRIWSPTLLSASLPTCQEFCTPWNLA